MSILASTGGPYAKSLGPLWFNMGDEEASVSIPDEERLLELLRNRKEWRDRCGYQYDPCYVGTKPKAEEKLAPLPEDLRAIAKEFLDLHEAWGTEFEVNDGKIHRDIVRIIWNKTEVFDRDKTWASFFYMDGSAAGTKQSWSLFAQENDREIYAKQKGDGKTLRRSHDFAEFIRRFEK